MSYETNGHLVTGTRTSDYAVSEIDLSVTTPSGTQIDVTVYQDTSGGTTADNTETLMDVSSGTVSLSNFEAAQGSTYWLRFDLSTTDSDVTPSVNSATVVANGLELSASGTGTLTGSAALTRARELAGDATGTLTASGTLYRVGPVYATTELPDVEVSDITPIDASVEDELSGPAPSVSNYGDVRLQARVTGSGDAYGTAGEVVVAHDGGDLTLTNLLDGEKYDLRARTETEHVVGTWAEVSAVTLLPAPSVTVASVGTNSVELSITDNADNEDAITVDRRQEYADGFGPWTELDSLAPDTTTFTDDDVVPGTTYLYRVSNVTEHVEAATTVETTTDADAVQDTTPRQSGWIVEITASDGATRTFTSEGDPQRTPSLKGFEEVRLPRRKDRTLDDPKWEDADVRVWQDGYRLPVDTLKTREQPTGQTALRCVGPAELYEPGTYEFLNTDVHEAVAEVLDDTDLPYTVVSPEASNRVFDTVDTESGFQGYYQDPGVQDPLYIDDNGLHLAQTNFWIEAEDEAVSGITQNVDYPGGNPVWSDGEAVNLRDTDVSTTIETDYEIPAEQFEIGARYNAWGPDSSDGDSDPDGFTGVLTVDLDGSEIVRLIFTGSLIEDTAIVSELSEGLAPGVQSNIPPGEHTLTFSVEDTQEGELYGDFYLDGFGSYDGRYHDAANWDMDAWDFDDNFNGPPLGPPGGIEAILLHNGFLSATGARVEATFNDVSGDQALALSNDYGANYTTVSNADTLETDFASPGPDIQMRVTLGTYGSRATETPLENYQLQSLEAYTLEEDVRNSPPLTNGQFEGTRADILTQLCNRGNTLWAAEWVDGEIRIRVSNVEDLTSQRDLDLVDYEWETQTLGRQVVRATIKGGKQSVRDEPLTADLGTAVPLANTNLVPGQEIVRDANSDTVYARGTDYEIDTYTTGHFRAQPTGNISDGQSLTIDYEFKPEGEWSFGDADERKHLKQKFVGASTDAICQSVAYYLVDTLNDPVVSGEATIDDVPPGFSLLDVFAADPLPADVTDSFVIENATVDDGQVTATLASRRPESEIITGIDRALGSVKDRV